MSISIPGADYTPQLAGYTGQGTFRFWCQKVLPLVYDDSLSYYELLCKVVEYLNNTIKDVSTLEDNLQTAWNYILSLDWVDGLVDDKLNEMVEDGTLELLLVKLFATKEVFRVNVAGFVDEPLSSENIVEAINNALEVSRYLYIPIGTYTFNTEISRDCDILLDTGCHIKTEKHEPAILFSNCKATICGGYLEAGENNNGNYYVYDDPNWEDIPDYVKRGGVGVVTFKGCSYVHVDGCSCRWCQFPFVVLTVDSHNITIENCKFMNVMHAAVGHYNTGSNIVYRNIYIKNIRKAYDQYYCYGIVVSTGYTLHDTEHIFEPPYNVTFTHCYIENSPDQAIDTHGSKNTTIDSNVLINNASAITCYNDCRRVPRPDGWIMTGTRITNNYCKSNKTGIYIDGDGNDQVAHPYMFVGSANERNSVIDADPDEPDGKFTDFTGCVIENNYFESANDYMTKRHSSGSKSRRLISFNNIASNVVFRNNFVKYVGEDQNKIPFALHRHYNISIEGNIFHGFRGLVFAYCCYGTFRNNTGIYYNLDETGFTHFEGGLYAYPWVRTNISNLFMFGEQVLEDTKLKVAYNDSLLPRSEHYPTDQENVEITVTNGVAEVHSYKYIPGMELTLTKGGTSESVWVAECVDFHHFTVIKSDRTIPENGVYVVTLNKATIGATYYDIKTATTTATLNVRKSLTDSTVIGRLENGAEIVIIYGDESRSYVRCLYDQEGTLKTGYVSKTYLTV